MGETSARSKVASALARFCASTCGASGNASAKARTMSGSAARRVDRGRHWQRHLVGRFDRTGDLLLETAGAPVPEHRRGPGEIPDGRRVTLELPPRHAAAQGLAVSEASLAFVAGRARKARIARQPRVVEQPFAERAFLLRIRIVGRKRHGLRPAERHAARRPDRPAPRAPAPRDGRQDRRTSAASVPAIHPAAKAAAILCARVQLIMAAPGRRASHQLAGGEFDARDVGREDRPGS